ncbi:hypothetical protein BJY04DRAFT_194068 [Aspergillus karnatakaensis]|uniref:uncharacterized protein n=1 Tax=Aspergillus karnatakaensis TaxID=1810916 RepID=UPI003CCCBCCF
MSDTTLSQIYKDTTEMLGLKNNEEVPPYEELESQGPRNYLTGYSSVPQAEALEAEAEEQGQIHLQPQPEPEHTPHQHAYLNRTSSRCRSNPFPPASTFQPHVHCKSCDGFLERQQKMRSQRFCCAVVAITFMMAFICGLILGIVIVNAKRYGH